MKTKADGRGQALVSRTTAAIINGEIDLSVWDDEELLRGQRRNKNGTWTGRPPVLVPAALHRELTNRRFQKAYAMLAYSLVDAVKFLRAIVVDEEAADPDRIKAAEIICDRVLGKPRESVLLDVQGDAEPWRQLLIKSIVSLPAGSESDENPEDDVVEGEVVDGPRRGARQRHR
jgi:hypothetical protein